MRRNIYTGIWWEGPYKQDYVITNMLSFYIKEYK